MSKYKVMASEGSFAANQRKAPDQSQKIVDAANKKIRGMEKAHDFEMQQRDIYLRAMKFAQGQEEQSRERNFELETQNRQAHINVVKQDFKNARTASQQMEQASIQNSEKMKGLFDLVPQFAEMYAANVERQDKEDRQAASVAAYEHGFTMDTLENVLALNDQLSLSQFQATDYIQSLREENGWSEDRINALYEYQYKTRGSKAWVDNVALANNSIEEFKYGLSTQLVENGALTPEQQIDAVRGYTQDFIGNISINGRPISAEVMSTIIAPKVRSAETRALNGLQKQRIDTRNQELTTEKNKVYANAFRLNGPAGLHAINGLNPSKEKRDELINFAINAHKMGVFSNDDLQNFFESKFEIEATGKVDTLAGHFLGDDKVADLSTYLQRVEKDTEKSFQDKEKELLRATNSEVTNRLIAMQQSGQPITEDMLDDLEKFGRDAVGVTYQSEEINYAREFMTPKAQIREATYEEGVKLVEAGKSLQDLREFGLTQSQLNQEVNGEPSLLQRAQTNEAAMQNPFYKDIKKSISEHIGGHKNVKNNAFLQGDKRGLNHEINYWNKAYRDKFWRTMKLNSQDAENAHEIALAATYKGIDDYLNVMDNASSEEGLTRWKKDMQAAQNEEVQLVEKNKQLTELRLSGANKGVLAQELGKELFMDATEAIESSTTEIPAMFRRAAEIYNMTPFEFQQYIAPAFGEDAVEFDATSAQTMLDTFKPERMPLIRNPYGTSARIERFKADAGTLASRVRGQSIDYDGTPTESLRRTGDQYMSYMTRELGLSRNHALGLLANMYRESTFNASVPSGDDGGAGGLFQWYAERQTAEVRKMVRSGDWKAQIRYALNEVGEPGQEFLQQDFANSQQAADWWMQKWERPAHPDKDSLKHTEILRHWN
jgi:hypothetical protein